jgi:hypothetical protein
MSFNEQPTEKDTFKQKKINDKGNRILEDLIQECTNQYGNFHAIPRDLQDQNDEGIDYQIEILTGDSRQSIITFSIQNKSEDPDEENGIQPNVKGDGIGKISYSIEIKHIWKFRDHKPEAVIITLVDIKEKVVYWHPIQLDQEIEDAIKKALSIKADQKTITFYFDPKRVLSIVNFPTFLNEVRLSDLTQGHRFHKKIHTSLIPKEATKTGRPLDDIYDHFKSQYQLISYVPFEILANHYPFKITDRTLLQVRPFHLATDNEEFFKLFEAIKIINDTSIEIIDCNAFPGVENPVDKLTTIMKWLTNNSVFFIELFSSGQPLSANRPRTVTYLLSVESTESVALTALRQLNFVELLKKIKTLDLVDENSLVHAYVHYYIGNYRTANRILKKLGKKAAYGSLQHYLSAYNRKRCLAALNIYYQSDYEIVEARIEIKEIDLDQQLTYYQESQRQAIKWIHDNSYYTNYEFEISTIVAEIKDNYHAQFRGGISENELLSRLQATYNAFENFIKNNMLFYEQYSNFTKIAELFAEGLFAGYATMPKGGSRLEAFDDWMLEKIIQDANAAKILKLANKYGIKNAIYKKTGFHNDSFEEIIIKFLTDAEQLPDLVDEVADLGNERFWSKYNHRLWTILVTAGVLQLDETFVNRLINKLLELVNSVDQIYAGTYQYLMFFLSRQSNYFGYGEFKKLLFILLGKKQWDRERTLEELTAISELRKLKLQLDQQEFERLFSYFLPHQNVDQNTPSLIEACLLIPIIQSTDQRSVWIQEIITRLQTCFDESVYVELVKYDVINFDSNLFEKFKHLVLKQSAKQDERIAEIKKKDPNLPVFLGVPFGDYRSEVNTLFDLVFKFNITLSAIEQAQISNTNLYYQWLSNISGFNYDLFLPEWINRHKTVYFFDEFKKHPALREALEKYLYSNDDLLISRIYFLLYHSNQ